MAPPKRPSAQGTLPVEDAELIPVPPVSPQLLSRAPQPPPRKGVPPRENIPLVPPGPPCDLRHFRRGQAALALAVELRQPRERNVPQIEIEPHSDRIGGDQVIDFTRLEQFDLAIAGFRAERAHHHRRAAAEPAQHFGHAIDLFGAERDDRAARAAHRCRLRGCARAQPQQRASAKVATTGRHRIWIASMDTIR